MKECCDTCKFKRKNTADISGRQMNCCFNPPGVHLIPGPGGAPVTVAIWPPVNGDTWCGRFEAEKPAVIQ